MALGAPRSNGHPIPVDRGSDVGSCQTPRGPRGPRANRTSTALLLVLAMAIGGCPPRDRVVRYDPIPLAVAVNMVNSNLERIDGALRAVGPVDGSFTLEDGRRRSYHLDGTLFCLAPYSIRFDLKKLGARQLLYGSNREGFWVYSKQDDAYVCGRQGVEEDLPPGLPVRPSQIIDALGLRPIPTPWATGESVRIVQRVVDDYQQVLFLIHDETGRLVLEKEYWLARFDARLMRRVIFRNGDGVVEMQSDLDEYAPLGPDGPMLPHVVAVRWPGIGAEMRFRVRRWQRFEQVGPDSIQFATPDECEGRW